MDTPLKDRVREARAAADLSQPEAAVAAGISLSALRNIEQGITTDPRLSTIRGLEDALGASLHEAASTTPDEESATATFPPLAKLAS